MQIRRDHAAQRFHILLNRFRRALSHLCAVRQVHAAHPGLSCKFNILRVLFLPARIAQMSRKLQCGFSLRRVVMEAGQRGAADQLAAGSTSHWKEIGSQPVPIGNGTGFVQNHRVHIAAGFHRLAGHGNHVKPGHTVHTRDTNGGKKSANGSRNQADSQCNQS